MPKALRLPAAILATIAVAELAAQLLRPRDAGPAPHAVHARAYFSEGQLQRAEDFRGGQRAIFLANSAIGLGVLVWFAVRPPLRPRRPLIVGAVLSLAVAAATLPLSALARERAKDVGLVTQSWTGWIGDVGKSWAIGAAIAGTGAALLVFAMQRLGRHWWIGGAAVVVAYGSAVTYAGPIVLDPLFNRFVPLPQGELRRDVFDLARRAGVDVGEVYEMDASRRTTASNAYVAGLGHTKRVVLYDNLIEDFSPAEVRLVVAHELGHVANRDVPKGLLFLAIVAPLGMYCAARFADGRAGADAIAPVALGLAVMAPLVSVPANQLSRAVERRADAFALRLTGEAATQIRFQQRIAVKNVGDPDPPAWAHFLFGTHPTTLQRIGQAQALRAAATRRPEAAAGPASPEGS